MMRSICTCGAGSSSIKPDKVLGFTFSIAILILLKTDVCTELAYPIRCNECYCLFFVLRVDNITPIQITAIQTEDEHLGGC